MILSEASSKSASSINCLFFLVAMIAASLHKLAISAPLNPGVNYANLLAISDNGLFGLILRGERWTIKIYYLALISGRVISTILSNLPGRVKAESKTSFLFVAAKTMTV